MNPVFDDAFIDALIERLEPTLSPGAKILRRRHGIAAFKADKSGIVGEPPLFVLQPREVYDVQSACRLATALAVENGGVAPVAIVARGGGTGLCGGAVPIGQAIVLDMTYMDSPGDPEYPDRTIFVQPGVTIGHLENMLSGSGLFFPVTPTGAAESATIGGVISTNARGMYAMKYGCAADNVSGVQIVLPDGSFVNAGHRNLHSSAGLNLVDLFVGAEGTLGIVVGATLRLHPRPARVGHHYLQFDSVKTAAFFCEFLVNAVEGLAACEILSRETIGFIRRAFPDCAFPDCGALVMMEVHNLPEPCPGDEDDGREWWLDDILNQGGSRVWVPPPGFDPWDARHRVTGVISESSENGVPVRFDCAVQLRYLHDYIAALQDRACSERHLGALAIFGHAGLGIVHVLIPTGSGDHLWPHAQADEFRLWAIDKALKCKGTVTGEHGVGMVLVAQAEMENSSSVELQRRIKKMIDPYGIMNPGKVIRNP